jgi:hypothetical protein
MRRSIAFFLAPALLCLGVFAQPVAAGQREMDRVAVSDIGVLDEGLTDACGFDVWVDATGHITFRLLTDAAGNPTREVNNFAIRVHFYSEFGSFDSVNVGPDRVTYLDDGSIILATTGNIQSITVPGQGRVVADTGQSVFHVTFPEDGSDPIFELIRNPGSHTDDPAPIACDVLDG